MLMDRCAKAFVKAFLSPFSDCGWITLHTRHIYSSQRTSLVSCKCLSSVVRRSHHNAAAAAVSCQKLEHRSLVQVCGTDILGFLQGLVTNDVKLLETDDSSVYAMMLNVQGRVLYDLILYRLKADKPTVLIECQHDVTSDLVNNLLRYKLRKKIDVTDVGSEFSVWSIFGEFHDMPDLHVTNKDVIVNVNDPRHRSFGRRLLMPSNVHAPVLLDYSSLSSGNYHSWRCQSGVGEGTTDFPPGQSFPLEANLDFMNGVSFSKGCYIGQELTARTNYTGVIRKRIMPLTISGQTQDVRAGAVVINASGKECGKLRSVYGLHALGLLRIDDVVGKGKLHVQVEDCKVADAETYIPSWWPMASDAVVQHAVARSERATTKD